MEKIKGLLASPEGAAAIIGLLRALFIVLIGVGVSLTQDQVDQALAVATSLMSLMSVVMTLFSVKTVRARADAEELDAALTGKVLATNDA